MKKGDRVICIDASARGFGQAPPLVKGREYIIYDYKKCPCGVCSYDVGLIVNFNSTGYSRCTSCGGRHINPKQETHWANEGRFAKVKEEYRVVKMEIEVEEPMLN